MYVKLNLFLNKTRNKVKNSATDRITKFHNVKLNCKNYIFLLKKKKKKPFDKHRFSYDFFKDSLKRRNNFSFDDNTKISEKMKN